MRKAKTRKRQSDSTYYPTPRGGREYPRLDDRAIIGSPPVR
jgi:hypothetical protein